MVGYPRQCTHHRGQPGGRADLVQLSTSGDLKLVGVGRGRLGLASTVVRLTDTLCLHSFYLDCFFLYHRHSDQRTIHGGRSGVLEGYGSQIPICLLKGGADRQLDDCLDRATFGNSRRIRP